MVIRHKSVSQMHFSYLSSDRTTPFPVYTVVRVMFADMLHAKIDIIKELHELINDAKSHNEW